MKLHDLKGAPGSRTRARRIGRGESSGWGKSSGRGTKGTKARKNVPAGFAGGQMPLHRRLPKWGGFTSRNPKIFAVVNLAKLEASFESGATVTLEDYVAKGLARPKLKVKVLGTGELTKSLTVRAHAFSKTAADQIAQAGGSTEVIA